MIRGGSPMVYDQSRTAQFDVLPKYAAEMRWVDMPNCLCFHLCNAWEEPTTGEVVVIGSCMTPPDSVLNECNKCLKSILFTGEINKFIFDDSRYGGEPYFVPSDSNSTKEDNSYILTFMHDEKMLESKMLIVNAANMQLKPIVKLPSRVPYDFHGTFINSSGLQSQA
ncbi:hypothetical protein Cni_G03256 [Canna indica]|uniref:9-cis-epoxycarotenoid dioxygenase n=1 Tax=Canna indica TaxID=4628 RepID=A0AAQ3Q3D6_9LILI|nr:hypothetical protein Cni_G03256 [Canna indica]